jgi:DNA-binding response OmpR family regulator
MLPTIPSVLLMDDEKSFRTNYSQYLSRGKRLKVYRAYSVKAASALMDGGSFDAGIFDIRMSRTGSEGLEIIEEFRDRNPNAYIEAVTAFDEYYDIALEKGADDVLIKPLKYEDDIARITKGVVVKKITPAFEFGGLSIPTISENLDDWLVVSVQINTIYELLKALETKMEPPPLGETISYREMIKKMAKNMLIEILNSNRKLDYNNSLSDDINLIAFSKQYFDIKAKYPNHFVAFVEGKLVDLDLSVEKLIKRVNTEYINDDCLIKKIDKIETLRIRGPRTNAL